MAAVEGEQDEIVEEMKITLPEEGDISRPPPIEVLLVGGPMDAQLIKCPVEATHVSYWVYKEPSLKAPPKEEWGTDKTMQIRYQIHPLIGNNETWHIGRMVGTRFDDAMQQIMEHYHVRSLRKLGSTTN